MNNQMMFGLASLGTAVIAWLVGDLAYAEDLFCGLIGFWGLREILVGWDERKFENKYWKDE